MPQRRVVVLYDEQFGAIFDRRASGEPAPVPSSSAQVQDANDAFPIRDALRKSHFDVEVVALGAEEPFAQLAAIARSKPDLVFNLCDSLRGRPSLAHMVPGFLSAHGVAHTGATAACLNLTKRKHDVKAVLMREGLPTPRFQVIEGDPSSFELRLTPPVILKLTGEHASVGIDAGAVCFENHEVVKRAQMLLDVYKQPVLVEEFVEGREIYVSCLGWPLRTLPFMEHKFDHLPAGFLHMRTFDTKWFDKPDLGGDAPVRARDERWARPVPERAPAVPWHGGIHLVEVVGRRALEACGARDWGRVDMRVDAGGIPLVIDVTPNSYLHPQSPCALAAKAADLAYDEVIAIIARDAISRGPDLA